MILCWWMIFFSPGRYSSHHYCINYLATFLQILHKLLLFAYLHWVTLFFGGLDRFQHFLLETCLPILIHEAGVSIRDRVKTSFVDLEEVFSDSCGVDPVIAHHTFRHVAKWFMVCLPVDSAQEKRNIDLFLQLYPQQVMSFSQSLQSHLELLTYFFSLHDVLHVVDASWRLLRSIYLRN